MTASGVEFAAALKVMALRVRAHEAALMADKLGAANGTELPPVLLFLNGLFDLGHRLPRSVSRIARRLKRHASLRQLRKTRSGVCKTPALVSDLSRGEFEDPAQVLCAQTKTVGFIVRISKRGAKREGIGTIPGIVN